MKPPNTRRATALRDNTRGTAICKTCSLCRQKKTKCDGTKPECNNCTSAGHSCRYPHDARREHRPSSSRMRALEDNLASLQGQINAATALLGAAPLPSPDFTVTNNTIESHASIEEEGVVQWARSPKESNTGHQTEEANQASDETVGIPPLASESPAIDLGAPNVRNTDQQSHQDDASSLPDKLFPIAVPTRDHDTMSLHPCEGRVAGVSENDGRVFVHGPSSILNVLMPPRAPGSVHPSGAVLRDSTLAAESRLIGNAAIQRQQEMQLYLELSYAPPDFDGIAPSLAQHLLELHWNGPHYTYMVTYRPAIIHSLCTNGKWINKLLLNAIYFSSSLNSDWKCLAASPQSSEVAGQRFYDRFRQLLVDEIGRPSAPSAIALLLVSSALVSHGQASAAWVLGGTALRMITDMGCHLVQDVSQKHSASHTDKLREDLELEVKKRLFWGAFMTDTALSLYLGRPSNMSLADSRVPQALLDTYEELECWTPFVEPNTMADHSIAQRYRPQPAYAISTFKAMCSLFTIAAKLNQSLYAIDSIKYGPHRLKTLRDGIVKDLQTWYEALPDRLRFAADAEPVPPPHQIAIYTTFHTINILAQRPFMKDGHLKRRTNEAEKRGGDQICLHHALQTYKYVEAYRRAFTLQQAPFIISYAVYSAVVVLLRQEQPDRSELCPAIAFFWKALPELQRGANFGLKKPLAVLRDMLREVGEMDLADDGARPQWGTFVRGSLLDKGTPLSRREATMAPTSSVWETSFTPEMDPYFTHSDCNFLEFLGSQEADISNDILYGLFAPG